MVQLLLLVLPMGLGAHLQPARCYHYLFSQALGDRRAIVNGTDDSRPPVEVMLHLSKGVHSGHVQ